MQPSNFNIQPAGRLASVQEYYFSRKLKEVAALNAAGRNIISLAIGSPDMPPSSSTIETLCREAVRPDAHGYQPTVGIAPLREAMAGFYKRWYGVELNPQTEIQPLIGSKEGILHVTLAFVNPGEKVLVPNPGYPTYTSLSRLLGCEIVNYDLRPEMNWQPDFDALGIVCEIDLRREMVGRRTESTFSSNMKYLTLPCDGYVPFLLQKSECKALMEAIADESNLPLVYHCIGGADRTGTLTLILQALCGVESTCSRPQPLTAEDLRRMTE